MSKQPLVSIVTVCYNAENEIATTIESVFKQTDCDYEYLIIDGGSHDTTVAIVQAVEARFTDKHIVYRYISESDRGIYDAMNKGIHMAQGEWVLFLNAGDGFCNSSALSRVKPFLIHEKCDIMYGDEYWIEENNTKLIKPKGETKLPEGSSILHQAAFVQRTVLQNNLFDLNYRIAGDYELFLRLYVKHYRFHYEPIVISNFAYGGISSTNAIKCLQENTKIQEKYGYLNTHTLQFRLGYCKKMIYCFIKTHIPRKIDLIIIQWKAKTIENKKKRNLNV